MELGDKLLIIWDLICLTVWKNYQQHFYWPKESKISIRIEWIKVLKIYFYRFVWKNNSEKILRQVGTIIRDCPVLVAETSTSWESIKTDIPMNMDNIIAESDSQIAIDSITGKTLLQNKFVIKLKILILSLGTLQIYIFYLL